MAFTARTETYVDLVPLTTPYDITVTKPTNTANGDILFCWLGWYTAVTIDSVPNGWTLLAEYLDNTDRYALYYKIAASEGASWDWSFTAATKVRAVCSCYTGGDFNAADPIDVVSNTAYREVDSYAIAASMSVTSVNSPLVFFAARYRIFEVTFTKPTIPTEDWVEDDDAGSTTSDFWTEVCSMIWSGSGATGDMSATMSVGVSTKHAFAVALNPSGGEAIPQAVDGALSFAGSLSSILIRIVAAGGSLTLAGAISRFTSKNVQGGLSFAGIITRRTFKSLAGALTSAGALAKMTQKILSGELLAVRYEYYNTGDNNREIINDRYWFGQTFTPSVAHHISSVKLKLFRSGVEGNPGTVTVGIRATDVNGHPTGSDLCSGTIDGNTLTTITSGAWYEITLGDGYNLDADTKYAIVVRAPDGDNANRIEWRSEDNSPTYAGGCGEFSSNSGASWTGFATMDCMFEEWEILAYGTLDKLPQKIMAGAISPAGALARNIYKIVAGALSPSGIISLGGAVVDLVGNLTSVGTLVKQTSKNLVGDLTLAGGLGIGVFVAISGTLTSAGSLVKNMSKNVVGLLASVGIITKYSRKLMSGTLTFTGLVQKMTSKIAGGVLSFVGALLRPGRDLKVRLFHRPYRDMSTETKPYRDMSVESKDD